MDSPTYQLLPSLSSNQGPYLHRSIRELAAHFPPLLTTAHKTSESGLPVIPGSGVTRRLVSSLPPEFPSTGVILEYVLEGDNRADAAILASALARSLQKELGISGEEPWIEPPSWQEGLFGAALDQSLFGYHIKVYDDISNSKGAHMSQTSSENVWEELDLTSFSELRSPYPVAGAPLRAVYRDKAVAFRYLFPCGSSGSSQSVEAVHRRFQVHFASADDAAALVRSIRNVCPCLEKHDQQPVTNPPSSSSSTVSTVPTYAMPGPQKRKLSELNILTSSPWAVHNATTPSSSITWDSLPVRNPSALRPRDEHVASRQDSPSLFQNRPRTQAPPLITVTAATSSNSGTPFQTPDWRLLRATDSEPTPSNETVLQTSVADDNQQPMLYQNSTSAELSSESSSLVSSPTPFRAPQGGQSILGARPQSVNASAPVHQHVQQRNAPGYSLAYPIPNSSRMFRTDSLPPSTPPEAINLSQSSSSPPSLETAQASIILAGMSEIDVRSMLSDLVNDPGFETMVSCIEWG
ncbi:hypothetical protein FRB90_000288 [Tulasnella sp. 427]|nr:hypothetical protein FRB90_000288 [Tulasnella sp. 427]